MKTDLVFDPLLPVWLIALIILALILASGFGRWRGLKSFTFRSLAALFLAGVLLNPQRLMEERKALPDIALILTDHSESMHIAGRDKMAAQVESKLKERIAALGHTEIVEAEIKAGQDGTHLTQALIESLGRLPEHRIGAVFAITDGVVHDLPQKTDRLLPAGVPFHALIIGDRNARDRRLVPLLTPRFGMVGEKTKFRLRLEDPGHEGKPVGLEIRLNGQLLARINANVGQKITIPVRIEKRGRNTLEIRADVAEDELTPINNVLVAEISGVRDRLRVLLITGEPHMGGRAWRNLLKSDPSVDLVQFTILTNPGVKNTFAPPRELALIRFPERELFEEKLEEFDLIIFDQFRRRTMGVRGRSRPMLNPYYIANIAHYVENGGALMIAAGPAFAGEESLAKSPLMAVLPARPNGKTNAHPFRARLSEKGTRHPITDIFKGETEAKWGHWYRAIGAEIIKGDVLMQDDLGAPLLVIDKVGRGRVALLLSDQAWLWARGHNGGGPYNELFRRLAHWLMSEPDLEADRLEARIKDGRLMIDHFALDDKPANVQVLGPDGKTQTIKLKRLTPGHFVGALKADAQGAYRISSGKLSTIAAAGALNPTEFSDVMSTEARLRPLVGANGGVSHWVGASATLPELHKTASRALSSNAKTARILDHKAYTVTASKRTPFAPGWLYLVFILAALLLAWRFEGR